MSGREAPDEAHPGPRNLLSMLHPTWGEARPSHATRRPRGSHANPDRDPRSSNGPRQLRVRKAARRLEWLPPLGEVGHRASAHKRLRLSPQPAPDRHGPHSTSLPSTAHRDLDLTMSAVTGAYAPAGADASAEGRLSSGGLDPTGCSFSQPTSITSPTTPRRLMQRNRLSPTCSHSAWHVQVTPTYLRKGELPRMRSCARSGVFSTNPRALPRPTRIVHRRICRARGGAGRGLHEGLASARSTRHT